MITEIFMRIRGFINKWQTYIQAKNEAVFVINIPVHLKYIIN